MPAKFFEITLLGLIFLIALAGLIGLIDKDVSSNMLSVISILLTMVYSYRRRKTLKKYFQKIR